MTCRAHKQKRLIVVQGPTGVGKTAAGVALAEHYGGGGNGEDGGADRREGVPIVSADSRQFYREMSIGTAVPTARERRAVPHYFVQDRSIFDSLTAGEYEREGLALLAERLFPRYDTVLVVGGSGLYVDALLEGFDRLPGGSAQLRAELSALSPEELLERLRTLDPVYYAQVDRHNPRRVMRAVEVCQLTGEPYSTLRRKGHLSKKERPFSVVRLGLELPRAELYERIDCRVDAMLAAGLQDEARGLYAHRHLPALQTVGYRELFDCFEGRTTLPQAVALIKQHTRNYAKRQLTWLRRGGPTIGWFHPADTQGMIAYIDRYGSV